MRGSGGGSGTPKLSWSEQAAPNSAGINQLGVVVAGRVVVVRGVAEDSGREDGGDLIVGSDVIALSSRCCKDVPEWDLMVAMDP